MHQSLPTRILTMILDIQKAVGLAREVKVVKVVKGAQEAKAELVDGVALEEPEVQADGVDQTVLVDQVHGVGLEVLAAVEAVGGVSAQVQVQARAQALGEAELVAVVLEREALPLAIPVRMPTLPPLSLFLC
jgi:hypothetical protein